MSKKQQVAPPPYVSCAPLLPIEPGERVRYRATHDGYIRGYGYDVHEAFRDLLNEAWRRGGAFTEGILQCLERQELATVTRHVDRPTAPETYAVEWLCPAEYVEQKEEPVEAFLREVFTALAETPARE